MDGYPFYCSKCKIDHAGECPPAVEFSSGPKWDPPKLDSWWIAVLVDPAMRRMAPRTHYQVTGFTRMAGLVEVQSGISGQLYQVEVEAWTSAAGGRSLADPSGDKWRMEAVV